MFSNRTTLREKELFGMLVSTVPFRVEVDPTLTFSSFARNLNQQQIRTMRHQKYPYNRILNDWRKSTARMIICIQLPCNIWRLISLRQMELDIMLIFI